MDQGAYDAAREILIKMGVYFQAQDDYLDCYGTPEQIGKIGTDIESKKCGWLVVQALERASPAQRKVLEENYAQKDDAKVAKVKAVYAELGLEQVFKDYEEESCASAAAARGGSPRSWRAHRCEAAGPHRRQGGRPARGDLHRLCRQDLQAHQVKAPIHRRSRQAAAPSRQATAAQPPALRVQVDALDAAAPPPLLRRRRLAVLPRFELKVRLRRRSAALPPGRAVLAARAPACRRPPSQRQSRSFAPESASAPIRTHAARTPLRRTEFRLSVSVTSRSSAATSSGDIDPCARPARNQRLSVATRAPTAPGGAAPARPPPHHPASPRSARCPPATTGQTPSCLQWRRGSATPRGVVPATGPHSADAPPKRRTGRSRQS